MLRRYRLRNAVLGLVLILGQWLAVAHAYEHPALSPEQVCQVCAHAQGLDAGGLAPKIATAPEIARDRPVALAPPAAPVVRRASQYRSRAPPSTFV